MKTMLKVSENKIYYEYLNDKLQPIVVPLNRKMFVSVKSVLSIRKWISIANSKFQQKIFSKKRYEQIVSHIKKTKYISDVFVVEVSYGEVFHVRFFTRKTLNFLKRNGIKVSEPSICINF